jgi:integrase
MAKKLIPDAPKGLRERRRSDGSTRIWWEPNAADRELGLQTVELDEHRLSWSVAQAKELNDRAARIRRGEPERRPTGARSMAALIADYKRSRHYAGLADATRRGYDGFLSIIERKWGANTVSDFTKPVISTWYETNLEARGKTAAQRLHAMLSILFNHAERLGWRPENSNPCRKIGVVVPKGRNRVATWDEIDALVDAADELELPQIALGILLSVYQGQRQSDVLAAQPADVGLRQILHPGDTEPRPTWMWGLVRSKRQTMGGMMLHPDIVDRVQRQLASVPADAPRLLLDPAGAPFTVWSFGRLFRQVRDKAAETVPALRTSTLQFRDLRRTWGNLARGGGASKDDAGDVLGNSAATNHTLADIYMAPQFWTASRAILAVQRPEPKKEKKA